jgi:hypothetical protein
MTPEFNAWWDEGEITTDNPYEADSFAFWAWEGWQAGVKAEREACRSIVMEAFDDTWSGTKENDILYEIAAAIRARSNT